MRLETTIIKNLIYSEDYLRKVLPFLREEYFIESKDKVVFNFIQNFVNVYKTTPTIEALKISVRERSKLSETEVVSCEAYIGEIESLKDEHSQQQWLIDKTEAFCQDRAIYNAVCDSVNILDGKDKNHDKGVIPKLLSDALAVCFDTNVGHDYFNDSDSRYEFYHKHEERIPFDLDYFNKITKGGLPNKTLSVILAGTGAGKSLFMCHHAAAAMSLGKNVLYITLEMAEERIAERIDANLLNTKLDDLTQMSKESYDRRVNKVREKTTGKLIIKEYPTASASTTHFRALLNELNLKKSFVPDIIFVDYLNISCSARIKAGANVNSYTYVKAIAEELRGLAVEFNVPIVTATQTTRSGYSSSDPGLEDTSESFGLPATADLMFALISNEDMDEMGQLMVKQLKNRFNDPNFYKRFVIGVDKSKMKLFDVEQSGQNDITDSKIPSMPVRTDAKKSFDGFRV